MNYSVFEQKAIAKDKRNKFASFDGNLDVIPEELRDLYRYCNPVDVELPYEGTSIRFFPIEELKTLQNEYKPQNGEFIFAACNGDPIWYHEGRVYTGPHGAKEVKWELLSEKIDDFLSSIVE